MKIGKRIPELDGLRGLAVLLILLAHYVFGSFSYENKSILANSVHFAFSLTWSGVDLFFVLSGFLIGGILIDQRKEGNYFKTFYIRRICRIFPLYFLWLICFALLVAFVSHRFHQKWVLPLFDLQGIPQWLYYLFIQNFYVAKSGLFGPTWLGATWSLAIEEQFYLLMPFVIWLTPARKLLYLLVSLIVAVPLFRIFLYLHYGDIFQYVLLPSRADSLLMGVLCAWLVRNESCRRWLDLNQSRLLQVFAILCSGVVYLICIAKGRHIFTVANLFDVVSWGYTWLASFYACLLLIVVTAKSGFIVSFMRFAPLRKLGTIAYGVYLIQGVILVVMYGLLGKESYINNWTDVLLNLAAFVATLLLAAFSWQFFERPIINWGHSFSYSNKKHYSQNETFSGDRDS